jgi:hypothetical protein
MSLKKQKYYGSGKTNFLLTNKNTMMYTYTCMFLSKSITFRQTILWTPTVTAQA